MGGKYPSQALTSFIPAKSTRDYFTGIGIQVSAREAWCPRLLISRLTSGGQHFESLLLSPIRLNHSTRVRVRVRARERRRTICRLNAQAFQTADRHGVGRNLDRAATKLE